MHIFYLSYMVCVIFQQFITKSGNTDFNIFQQQDAGEVLGYILEALCNESIITSNLLTIQCRQHITCTMCQQISLTEESSPIFELPVLDSIQSSLNAYLTADQIDDFYCNFCCANQPAIIDHEITKIDKYFIVQLKRFYNFQGV